MKINRIPAFTLVEIIIVLLLTLLVVNIVFVGYNHFEKYRAIQYIQTQRLEDILTVKTGLLNCFEQASKIKKEDNKVFFMDSVVFASCEFMDNTILIKRGSRVDNLNLKINNLKFVGSQDHIYIEGISFGLDPEGIKFQFRKCYGSVLKFNTKE